MDNNTKPSYLREAQLLRENVELQAHINQHRQTAEAVHHLVQSLTTPSKPMTSEQRVVITVCDEWLREAGLPTYSELTAPTRGSASAQG